MTTELSIHGITGEAAIVAAYDAVAPGIGLRVVAMLKKEREHEIKMRRLYANGDDSGGGADDGGLRSGRGAGYAGR